MELKFNTIFIVSVLILASICKFQNVERVMVTTYDALGYYMYLPGVFIYQDLKELAWFPEVDKQYGLTQGNYYQANKCDNGNYVFKYFGGVAFMEMPIFLLTHTVLRLLDPDRADGFSEPYQWAVLFSSLLYSLMGLYLLQLVLRVYYEDYIVTLTLSLVYLASNIIQYISIDCGQTHSYLFFIYTLVIYLTQRWHIKPTSWGSLGIGAVCGMAIFIRPSEAIIVLIPLLWQWQSTKSISKWAYLHSHYSQLILAVLGGLLMLSFQLVYWYYVTGQIVYNVGSKWTFLNPFFRVLFGWEKGWFIYTPVSILFILSLFFLKGKAYRNSIIAFTFLNIWIVISWYDWRYGGSYSTRALSQSYPLFALSLGAMLQNHKSIYKWGYLLAFPLILINLFQLYQYNKNILHYNDMNQKYYSRIFLNPFPTAEDYSLLDNDQWCDMTDSNSRLIVNEQIDTVISGNDFDYSIMLDKPLNQCIKVALMMNTAYGIWDSKISCKLSNRSGLTMDRIFRLAHPDYTEGQWYSYPFFIEKNLLTEPTQLEIKIINTQSSKIYLKRISVSALNEE